MKTKVKPRKRSDARRAELLDKHLNQVAELYWKHYLLTGQFLMPASPEDSEAVARFHGGGVLDGLKPPKRRP